MNCELLFFTVVLMLIVVPIVTCIFCYNYHPTHYHPLKSEDEILPFLKSLYKAQTQEDFFLSDEYNNPTTEAIYTTVWIFLTEGFYSPIICVHLAKYPNINFWRKYSLNGAFECSIEYKSNYLFKGKISEKNYNEILNYLRHRNNIYYDCST